MGEHPFKWPRPARESWSSVCMADSARRTREFCDQWTLHHPPS